jgi:hypothetical protein
MERWGEQAIAAFTVQLGHGAAIIGIGWPFARQNTRSAALLACTQPSCMMIAPKSIEPKSVVVALYAKGKAKRDITGFTQIKGVHYA